MRSKIDLKGSWLYLFFCLLIFTSCEQEMDKYYEIPGWLKGNAKEILEKRGNYTYFLNAVERVGYTDVISGRGIVTVVAPTDEAFKKWLTASGYGSIDEVPLDELNKVVTFHLVYYSFDKASFANYRPEGAQNENTSTANTAGLYYKFRTRSKDPISQILDNTTKPGDAESVKSVYHYDRFVPVLSTYLFNTKGIDAKYNYEYFYPENTWNVEDGEFCISNASVDEYAIVADNGFVYLVDNVLNPLETIYTELDNTSSYSEFLNVYNRFTAFEKDEQATIDYGDGKDLYIRGHLGGLPQIAWEWPTFYYYELATLSRVAYNVFAPSNQALNTFFNEFWGEYYDNLDEIPFTPLKFFLSNHVYTGDIVFPQEITEGKISTNYGNTIIFNPDNTDLRTICSNGTLYGLNNVVVPRMFESVTRPMFQNPDFNYFLLLIDNSYNQIPSLMSDNMNFSLFLPTNETVINTTVDGSGLQYVNPNPNLYAGEEIQIDGGEAYVSMGLNLKNSITSNHIGTRLVSAVGTNKIFETLNSFQYLWLDEANGKIYSSAIFNNYPDKAPTATPIYNAYNGTTYRIEGDDIMMLLSDDNLFKTQITANTPPDFQQFATLCRRAQFTLSSPVFNFLLGNRFIVLIPENDAISGAATGEIPTNIAGGLDKYLKYYFVNISSSNLGGYPFPGAGIEGEVETFCYSSDGEAMKLTIIDTGTEIQFKDAKGNIAKMVKAFPNIYGDGAAYLIDGLLSFE